VVTHGSPAAYPQSLSSFILDLLIFGIYGIILPGSTLQASVPGADANLNAPIDGNTATGLVPISSFGS